MRRCWVGVGVLALLMGGFGCSAPHDNPLDPDSDRYRPQAAPVSLVGRVHSEHLSRIFPTTDSYSAVAELSGGDAVLQDSVWVSFMGRTPVALTRTSATTWATVFSASYFGQASQAAVNLGSAIGLPFVFTTLDQAGVRHETAPVYLIRVVDGVPRVSEPDSQDVVGPHVTLVWDAFAAPFRPFSYRCSVRYQVSDEVTVTAWTSPALADSVLRVDLPDSLADGQYYWTVFVQDSFGNFSRSKEGYFQVQAVL